MGVAGPATPRAWPLFLVLALGKLYLCLARTSGGWGGLALNVALALLSEAAFIVVGGSAAASCAAACHPPAEHQGSRAAAAGPVPRRCRRWGGVAALYLLLPALQVLAIADFIHIGLVGVPLSLRLLSFFVANLFSDYVQQVRSPVLSIGPGLRLSPAALRSRWTDPLHLRRRRGSAAGGRLVSSASGAQSAAFRAGGGARPRPHRQKGGGTPWLFTRKSSACGSHAARAECLRKWHPAARQQRDALCTVWQRVHKRGGGADDELHRCPSAVQRSAAQLGRPRCEMGLSTAASETECGGCGARDSKG